MFQVSQSFFLTLQSINNIHTDHKESFIQLSSHINHCQKFDLPLSYYRFFYLKYFELFPLQHRYLDKWCKTKLVFSNFFEPWVSYIMSSNTMKVYIYVINFLLYIKMVMKIKPLSPQHAKCNGLIYFFYTPGLKIS